MKIKVQCTSKNERLEGNSTVADITLSPVGTEAAPMYAPGSAVGTPNAPTPEATPQVVQYNLNGALSFTVRDEKEVSSFKVGKTYALSVSAEEVEEAPKDKATK